MNARKWNNKGFIKLYNTATQSGFVTVDGFSLYPFDISHIKKLENIHIDMPVSFTLLGDDNYAEVVDIYQEEK